MVENELVVVVVILMKKKIEQVKNSKSSLFFSFGCCHSYFAFPIQFS